MNIPYYVYSESFHLMIFHVVSLIIMTLGVVWYFVYRNDITLPQNKMKINKKNIEITKEKSYTIQ